MSKTTLGIMTEVNFSERLLAAVDVRIRALGLAWADVGEALHGDREARKLRAWCGGTQEPRSGSLFDLDQFFGQRGLPGLVADIHSASGWDSRRMKLKPAELPTLARKLVECAAAMREAYSIEEFLAERGLLAHAHVMVRNEADSVCIVQAGSKMKAAGQINHRSIYGRDIRNLEPRGYGVEVYPQVMECLTREEPGAWALSSPMATYRRVGVPVGCFYVAMSWDIQTAPGFELR